MFVVKDDEFNLIAYHEDYEVCERYTMNVSRYHGDLLFITKAKKKEKHLLNEDLYLVRFGYTYIQYGYLQYVEFASSQLIDDVRYSKDVLCRMLEDGQIKKKKDKKIIEDAIRILEDVYENDASYTPTLKHLKSLKDYYDPYIYNTGMSL